MNLLFLCCGDVLQFVEYMFGYASCLHLHHLSYAVKTKLSFLIAILECQAGYKNQQLCGIFHCF